MALVAALSVWRTRLVSRELQSLTTVYFPLDRRIENAGAHVLEQEIFLERMIEEYHIHHSNTQKAATLHKEWSERGQQASAELQDAADLLEQQRQITAEPDQLVHIARLQLMLENSAADYADFEDHSKRIWQHLRNQQYQPASLLEADLHTEEDQFDRQIDKLRSEIQQITALAADRASRHETEVIVLNSITTLLASLIAILTAVFTTRRLVQPIQNLMNGTRAIGDGDLETEIPVTSSDELGSLTRAALYRRLEKHGI